MSDLIESGTQAFFDPEGFPWTEDFIRHHDAIRAEIDAQDRKLTPLYPEYIETVSGDGATGFHWFTRTLTFFTIANRPMLAEMPVTARLLAAVPGCVSAVLTRLHGDTHLKPHGGYTPDVLRCHFGVVVPEPDQCILRVDRERRTWRERGWLIFDDYLEHEVWYTGSRPRTVLLIDVVRPGLAWSPRQVAERFFARGPEIRWEASLDRIATMATWQRWLADGEFSNPTDRTVRAG